MKRILGLDLGTTSVGWALVNEATNDTEKSSIEKVGVRIVLLSSDEESDFQKGKSITINADRTLKRGARRNLDRYQLRRKHLRDILMEGGLLKPDTELAESEKNTTHKTWELRAKAASEKIEFDDFVRVLFAINKKRGYKSNRKEKSDESEGQAIDGMEIAKQLYKENFTPGQLVYSRLQQGIKIIPEFYPSDLQNEFDRIWTKQSEFYPFILNDKLKEEIKDKNKTQTWAKLKAPLGLEGIKLKENGANLKKELYRLRVMGITERLEPELLAIALQEVNNQKNGTSGYLGAISDRSKALYFNKHTVGQYLYSELVQNPHFEVKNKVFYRADYLDEFEKIWEEQANYYPSLTNELKEKVRDTVIFFQRNLKSQKGLISICELEGFEKQAVKNGNLIFNSDGTPKIILVGPRVCPKSASLFQEFKIWQKLNDLEFKNITTKENIRIQDFEDADDFRNLLFEELNIKGALSETQLLQRANLKKKDGWEINFKKGIDGNNLMASMFKVYEKILEFSGHEVNFSQMNSLEIKETVQGVFSGLGINTEILEFNAELENDAFEQQASYQLWHLLYSYQEDKKGGTAALLTKLEEKFGFEKIVW